MKRAAIATALLLALLAAGLAEAELIQRGDLRLDFRGRFAPQDLPRERSAPVSVEIGGSVRSVDGGRPPELRRIEIAVNRYGEVFTRGLPTCRAGQLQSTSTKLALAACRPALVGRGQFGATVDFAREGAFPFAGRMLAFNAGTPRRPALLLHIYGTDPVKATIVVGFRITRPSRGNFGTVFTARIPHLASDLAYVSDISLRFSRTYTYQGRKRSFISARCAAPAGFGGGPFAFARGKFVFSNGQTLTSTLTRACRVR